MAINVAEITSVLKQEIAGIRSAACRSTKSARSSKSATASPASTACATPWPANCWNFKSGVMGQVFNLEEDSIGAVIFGDYLSISEGESVKSTGRLLEVPVGDAVMGRVVNPLGQPLDGGPDHHPRNPQDGHRRPRHRRTPAGQRTAANRHQGHRLHDPHRPRPARTDHRRPQDRQNRHRPGHHHQPKGHRA